MRHKLRLVLPLATPDLCTPDIWTAIRRVSRIHRAATHEQRGRLFRVTEKTAGRWWRRETAPPVARLQRSAAGREVLLWCAGWGAANDVEADERKAA